MKTYKYGITGKVERDFDPASPREWDNTGTMACWHRDYTLGDVQPSEDPQEYRRRLAEEADPTAAGRLEYWENHPTAGEEHIEERTQAIINKALDQYYVVLPLYLYDHSGITMNTAGFSCPWDSGQVGVIYVSTKDACKEFGWKVLTKARRLLLETYLRNEVKTYDQYLTGDVWGYTVEGPGGEHLDSCWGFYGEDEAEAEMDSVARWHEGDFEKEIATETLEEVEG